MDDVLPRPVRQSAGSEGLQGSVADFRGLKNSGDIHKLYYAWLKATNPYHEDLDDIGERKITEAEAREMAAEDDMERQQWREAVQCYEEAGTYMGRG